VSLLVHNAWTTLWRIGKPTTAAKTTSCFPGASAIPRGAAPSCDKPVEVDPADEAVEEVEEEVLEVVVGPSNVITGLLLEVVPGSTVDLDGVVAVMLVGTLLPPTELEPPAEH